MREVPQLYLNVILFSMVLLSFILGWLSVFALTNPGEYVKWLAPVDWLNQKVFGVRALKNEKPIAYTSLFFSLSLLMTVCFLLGGWFTTVLLHLWSSPYLRIFGY